jgi:ribosomal protein S12 methylthiotransferase accessory factor
MTESKQGVWTAPCVGTLASLLATPQTPAALLEQIPAGAGRDSAARLLEQMISRGLVESAVSAPYVAQLYRESGVPPQSEGRDRWKNGATVRDLTSSLDGNAIRQALADAGAPLREDGHLQIVAVEDYLDPRLAAVQHECQRKAVPWVLVKVPGTEVWIGPFFTPGRTSCWRCLEIRLREKAWVSSQIAPDGGVLWKPYAPQSRIRAAAEFAAQEIMRWLLEMPDSLEGAIWSFSWSSLRADRHPIARLPKCPNCWRTLPDARPERIELRRPIAQSNLTDGLRQASPQAVLERLEPLASQITGIVRRLERRDLAPAPLVFTYGAVYNITLPPPALRIPDAILQPGVCSGHGWTTEEARAACMAEAVERYSISFRGDEPRVTARYCDLGEDAIHPNRVLLFSERQLIGREDWNRRHGPDDAVPERFDEGEEIEWIEGWSLTAQRRRFLPMALASLYYRPPCSRWIADADSNGCASGSSVEEAALHGILELVERDALGIWWFSQVARPADHAMLSGDLLCRRVCGQLEDQGWQVWVEDIATDLGVPVFVALGVRQDGWIRGAAAHLDASTALRNAVRELWQLSKAPARPGLPPSHQAAQKSTLIPHTEECATDRRDLVEECCGKIARAGHEVIVFDLTRPEIAFPVVRVVAPGLRHAKPRFAPGRLYDVPVRLGWLKRARTEEELLAESI